MSMTKAFKGGLLFYSRANTINPAYSDLKSDNSIKKAWKKTGRQIEEAIAIYDAKTKETKSKNTK